MRSRISYTVYGLLTSCSLSHALPPIAGPLLPRPSNLSSSPSFINATNQIEQLLNNATSNTSDPAIHANNASFSLAITSFSAAEDHPILWDYHYLAPEHSPNGTNTATGSSQYMIGSITKVFTNLLVLKSNVDINAPATRYLPELNQSTFSNSK